MGRGGPAVARPAQLFREFDALAYDGKRLEAHGDQKAAINHIAKRRQKNKGAEVVFNPAAHNQPLALKLPAPTPLREYLTGFHKRKQQRRKDAAEHIAKKQRLDRNQQRVERRTALKEELGLDDDFGVEPSSEDEDNGEADIAAAEAAAVQAAAEGRQAAGTTLGVRGVSQVYSFQGLTTTVTTLALDPDPDEAWDTNRRQAAPSGSNCEAEEALREGPDYAGSSGRNTQQQQQQQGAGKSYGDNAAGSAGGGRVGKKPKLQGKLKAVVTQLLKKKKKGGKKKDKKEKGRRGSAGGSGEKKLVSRRL